MKHLHFSPSSWMKGIFLLCFITLSTFSQAQDKLYIKSEESIPKHFIGIRAGAGLDRIFVLNAQVGFYVVVFSNDKSRVSLDNSINVQMPWLLFERSYYPSIRYQRYVKNHWIGCSYGMEFSRVTDNFEEYGKTTDSRTHRIDLSLTREINRRFNLEMNLPIRLDRTGFLTGVTVSGIVKI